MAPFTLTSEQIAKYHKDGYLLLRVEEHNLIDPQALQTWTAEVKGWPKENGKWMPYEEINQNGDPQLLRTEKFIDYHPQFQNFLCGSDVAALLKQISGNVSTAPPSTTHHNIPHTTNQPLSNTPSGHAPLQGQNQL